ncbi:MULTISPECIES: LLM class F420-dependent oxidoreductase [Protofrankia]|uniref:FMN reductase n=1 Tax=Protofrankia coriariae TaxID=1562887 RepID=A0ABR5F2U1_9ACTN|nr:MULTISPECIES: LLM class F420-dependent oxidoreductase [Protofrankia]KLL11014.1 FMN reductase [Protofrankia coriariae]ONH33973.1 LLM class F420-dependent oxidoreductase [Protofrankia sp. BMG5.30]
MRVGIYLDDQGRSLDAVVAAARDGAKAGFASAWMTQFGGWDALTALAVVGRETSGIEVGTAVVPTYPRHPLVLASQALTVQAAVGNRLTLGIGVSHRPIVEGQFGYSFDRPVAYLREYLSVLVPLLHGESVTHQGASLTAVGAVDVPGGKPPSLLIGALGPAMLRTAGEFADGTVTTWTGPATLADHIVPTITRAASAAGRPDPRVVALSFVCVTADADARREWVAQRFAMVGQLPSYRAVLDREGVDGPGETVILGDEASVERQIRRLASAGVTELVAQPIGSAREQATATDLLVALNTPPAG